MTDQELYSRAVRFHVGRDYLGLEIQVVRCQALDLPCWQIQMGEDVYNPQTRVWEYAHGREAAFYQAVQFEDPKDAYQLARQVLQERRARQEQDLRHSEGGQTLLLRYAEEA